MTGLVAHTATAPLGSGCIYSAPSYKMGESSADPGLADALSIASAASEQQPESDLEKGIRWAGQYGLYQHLLAEEELRYSSNVLSTFFTEQDNGIMGRLHRAIKGFNAARTGQASLTDHAGAISAAGQSALLPEQRLAEVLGILSLSVADLAQLGSASQERLRVIAAMCPIDEGFGVYIARAALRKIDLFPMHYMSECERTPAPAVGKSHGDWAGRAAKFYPNPNNGMMMMEYYLRPEERGTLSIHSLLGQKLLERQLDASQSVIVLDLGNLSPGTYLCIVDIEGRDRVIEKVSILK